jgi:hypothetical protein
MNAGAAPLASAGITGADCCPGADITGADMTGADIAGADGCPGVRLKAGIDIAVTGPTELGSGVPGEARNDANGSGACTDCKDGPAKGSGAEVGGAERPNGPADGSGVPTRLGSGAAGNEVAGSGDGIAPSATCVGARKIPL